MTNLRVTCSCW